MNNEAVYTAAFVAGGLAGAVMSRAGAEMNWAGAVMSWARVVNLHSYLQIAKKVKWDRPTDRPIDLPTDTVTYRSRCPRQKDL